MILGKTALQVLSILAIRQWEGSGSQHLIGMNTEFKDSRTRIQIPAPGTLLVAQWLRLCTPNGGGLVSTPSQGSRAHMLQLRALMLQLKIPHAITKTRHNQMKKLKEKSQLQVSSWVAWVKYFPLALGFLSEDKDDHNHPASGDSREWSLEPVNAWGSIQSQVDLAFVVVEMNKGVFG